MAYKPQIPGLDNAGSPSASGSPTAVFTTGITGRTPQGRYGVTKSRYDSKWLSLNVVLNRELSNDGVSTADDATATMIGMQYELDWNTQGNGFASGLLLTGNVKAAASTTISTGSVAPKFTSETRVSDSIVIGQVKSGTATAVIGTNTVTGIGTSFTTDYAVGDLFMLGSEALRITAVNAAFGAAAITVTSNWATGYVGAAHYKGLLRTVTAIGGATSATINAAVTVTNAPMSAGFFKLKGTVVVSSGDLFTVVGTGTEFQTELAVGADITIGIFTRTVASIRDNLTLTVTEAYEGEIASTTASAGGIRQSEYHITVGDNRMMQFNTLSSRPTYTYGTINAPIVLAPPSTCTTVEYIAERRILTLDGSVYSFRTNAGALISGVGNVWTIGGTGFQASYVWYGTAGDIYWRSATVGGRVILNDSADASGGVTISGTNGRVGFYGSVGVVKPTVSGAKGGNAALASLIAALVAQNQIVDTTTA